MRQTIPLAIEDVLAPAQTTLVVWDMQRGLAGHTFNVESLVAAAGNLIDAARRSGVLVTWTRHSLPPYPLLSPPALRDLMKRQKVTRPEDLRPFMQGGSADVEFLAPLAPGPDDLVIEKSTRSLFVGTPAEVRLRDRGITTLVLLGASTDQGIEVTARHAFALGFFPVVVEDAVSSRTLEGHRLGLSFLRLTQTDLATAEVVTNAWRSG